MAQDRPALPKNTRFRLSSPLVHDDGSPVAAEWHLRCPVCDYDLTGLPHRRCPECGRIFDPHAIWVARRRQETGADQRTPVYVIYGLLAIGLAIFAPLMVVSRPVMLLPLGVLPLFECGAWFLNRRAAEIRSYVVALAAVACVVVWGW